MRGVSDETTDDGLPPLEDLEDSEVQSKVLLAVDQWTSGPVDGSTNLQSFGQFGLTISATGNILASTNAMQKSPLQ